MAEIRLIDGNELRGIESLLNTDIIQSSKEASWLMSQVLHDIDAMPTIDPETLPIVRELREKLMLTEANQQHFKEERDEFEFKMREVAEAANAEIDRRNKTIAKLREKLERVTAERNAALKWVKELKSEKAAAIGELNGVLESVYRLTEFVDDEVHPVVDYDLYLQLRDMVDEVIRCEHADEWGAGGDRP